MLKVILHRPWKFDVEKVEPLNIRSCVDFNQDPDIVVSMSPVADPGFPVGGRGPVRESMDLRHRCFLAKMYAKMKELGPVGGRDVCPARPPRSTNGHNRQNTNLSCPAY